MPAQCIWEHPVAVRFLRRLHGASHSMLIQASDGHLYVVKYPNNPQGPNVLFNEAAGTELFRACGLPTPRWSPIVVLDFVAAQFVKILCESDVDAVCPEAGVWFGSRYIGNPKRHSYDFLPGSRYSRLKNRSSFWLAWLIDCCAEQTDLRQSVFIEDANCAFHAVFVDHGCLFGGAGGAGVAKTRSGEYWDVRAYPPEWRWTSAQSQELLRKLDRAQIRRRIERIPKQWWCASAFQRAEQALERISNVDYVESVAGMIVKTHKERTASQQQARLNSAVCPGHDGILHCGVQTSSLRPDLRSRRTDLPARA